MHTCILLGSKPKKMLVVAVTNGPPPPQHHQHFVMNEFLIELKEKKKANRILENIAANDIIC
jgi:hypothetical protein